MKILVINGPNINMLGTREPEIYGSTTMENINKELVEFSKQIGEIEFEFFQSNHEGEIIDKIREKRLRLVIVGSITLDCRTGQTDPMSEAFLQMAGVFSQLELAMIRARVRSGMENARAKGAAIGRPRSTAEDIPAVFLRHYAAYKEGRMNVSELARVCQLSRGTVYKYLRLLG